MAHQYNEVSKAKYSYLTVGNKQKLLNLCYVPSNHEKLVISSFIEDSDDFETYPKK